MCLGKSLEYVVYRHSGRCGEMKLEMMAENNWGNGIQALALLSLLSLAPSSILLKFVELDALPRLPV